MNRDIRCVECDTEVTLQGLPNDGVVIGCDHQTLSTLPYDFWTDHLPDEWYVENTYPTADEREEMMRCH